LRETVTVAGFLAWLDEVEDAETDALATPALDAVTVMTCHKAKGLEWPVVILAELEKSIRSGVWSISTFSEGDFRADNPLAGRCIHYWPWPFGKQSTGIDVLETIEASEEYQNSLAAAVEEGKRLLYVAMTRPRDMLVLAHNPKGRSANSWIRTLGADWLIPGDKLETPLVLPDGKSIPSEARLLVAEEPAQQEDGHKTLFWFQSAKDRSEYPPLFVSPSGVEGRETSIICQENIGPPCTSSPANWIGTWLETLCMPAWPRVLRMSLPHWSKRRFKKFWPALGLARRCPPAKSKHRLPRCTIGYDRVGRRG
jgi:ATP-dependent helicase/nuclease subunit A